jgi:glutamate-5-semialdehyde dehydrogenase
MATTAASVTDICAQAKQASRRLAALDSETKDRALGALASALEERAAEILEANERDMEAGRESGLTASVLDRLRLDADRLATIAGDVRDIAALPDPVGEVVDQRTLPNGIRLEKVLVPMGVVAVVYEARPNVTIDCSALCIKSGNAIVLRGSSMAAHSNAALASAAVDAVEGSGLPPGSVSLVAGGDRDELRQIASADGLVDLVIPRGGEGLKAALKQHATVPVMYAAAGNCHVYVDAEADVDMAIKIAVNAKTQRPSVCNAAETLVVHSRIAPDFLPRALGELLERGVELRVDGRTRSLAGDFAERTKEASEEDWATEFHDLILAVKVVDSVDEAIDHVNRWSSGHSEAIVTASEDAARAFTTAVDAACVYVNASTRFTDGAEFGMGAEIGNSTQKLHARGPIGTRELCSFKWIAHGDGQVKE